MLKVAAPVLMLSSLLLIASCAENTSSTAPSPVTQQVAAALPPAPLTFPAAGTTITYEGTDSERGERKWTGTVSDGAFREIVRADGHTRSLYPGCLLHCNQRSHPIDEEAYRKLFPMAVGKKAEFTRRRADGSRAWRHNIEVTGIKQVDTPVGSVDAFVIESRIKGIEGNRWTGTTTSYWAPSLGATVYEENTGGGWRGTLTLTQLSP